MKRTALAALILAACTGSQSFRSGLVHDRARFDLGCKKLEVTPLGGDAYGVAGCGRRATYVVICTGGAARQDLCTAHLEARDK
jgi:hypothetical protein